MGFKGRWRPNRKLPVCSVAMTVDYKDKINAQLHCIAIEQLKQSTKIFNLSGSLVMPSMRQVSAIIYLRVKEK